MTDPYRIRPPEVWVQARDSYLAGLDAESVCRRYDLGLSAFRRRARKYGWRRADQADPAAGAPDLSIYADFHEADEIETARLRYLHALEHGRPMEAVRWRRLWLDLCEENRNWLEALFPDRPPEEVRAQVAAARARDESPEEVRLLSTPGVDSSDEPESEPAPSDPVRVEKVHDVHSIFSRVHNLEDARLSKRAARRRRGRGGHRQGGP